MCLDFSPTLLVSSSHHNAKTQCVDSSCLNGSVYHLHLITHTTLSDTVRGSRSSPEVGKAFDGQWITTVAIAGNFEVQITVV